MATSLNIYQGATFSHAVTINRASTGTGMDLTAATVRCELRPAPGSTELTAEMTVEEVDMPNGQIRITLTDEQTAAFTTTSAFLDFLIEWADGTAQRSPAVKVFITKRITV